MKKRKATRKQLENLAKGREIQFQNQLKKRGINPNVPPRTIIKEKVRQSAVTNMTQSKPDVQLSLFNKFVGLKFFPIAINNKKETLNIKEIINHIFSRLETHRVNIHSNNDKIEQIINYLNSRDDEYANAFSTLNMEMLRLKEENIQLKEQIKVLSENETKNKSKKD